VETVVCPRVWCVARQDTVSAARHATLTGHADMVPEAALVARLAVLQVVPQVAVVPATKRNVAMAACPREWFAVIQDIVSRDRCVLQRALAAIDQAVAVVEAAVAQTTTTMTRHSHTLESLQHLLLTRPHSLPLQSSPFPLLTTTSFLRIPPAPYPRAQELVVTMMETAVATAIAVVEATVALSFYLASSWVCSPYFHFFSKLQSRYS
jgi:hypothetical protein